MNLTEQQIKEWKEHKTKHPLYPTWSGMKQRCLNPKSQSYKNYGGRGITICERWMDFCNFVADMGPRPNGLSLGRIDNDGGYEPSNCRWETTTQQSHNRRRLRWVTFKGRTETVMDWAKITGIDFRYITWRLDQGWSVDDALTVPPQHDHPTLRSGTRRRGRFSMGGKTAITFNGKTMTVSEWSRETGINNKTLGKRFRAGWPVHLIFHRGKLKLGNRPAPLVLAMKEDR